MKRNVIIALILLVALAAYSLYMAEFHGQGQDTDFDPDAYQEPPTPAQYDEYDVIVIGGEPEGVAAAVFAARNGLKTLLVEEREGLGGLMTFGMLNYIDMVQGIGNKNAIGGTFLEWHKLVGGDNAFDIELAKKSFLKLVMDEDVDLSFNTVVTGAMMAEDGKTVIGAILENEHGIHEVRAKRFIDATQDADFVTMAGAPYYLGGEDINLRDRKMAVTLMIHLHDVDWSGVRRAVKEQTFGEAYITDSVAWGFNDLHYDYQPVEENTRLRGLNLVQIKNEPKNDYYINALQIFGINGLNPEELEYAIEKGKRETDNVLAYLRESFPGFENATIASYPTELYVRETRHVKAEYMLPMSDVWTHRDHWDSIGFGGYPVDVQATSVRDYGYVLSNPVQYAIPFRSLVPLEVENVAMATRSAGYSSLAAGSSRIIPTGMATGDAAAVAAAISIREGITFRELAYNEALVEEMRATLKAQGAKVDYFDIPYPYQGEWIDESIQLLIDYGLVVGGYENDLNVQQELSVLHFANILSNGLFRSNMDAYNTYNAGIRQVDSWENVRELVFTRDEIAAYILSAFKGVENGTWEQALEAGLIDQELYNRVPEDDTLTREEGYYLAAYLIRTYGLNQ